MIEGVDYSFSRPDPAGLYEAGFRFVCRYLSYDDAKDLHAGERDALWDAGLAVVLNWEGRSSDALGGRHAGLMHATSFRQQAHALGADRIPGYFSADLNLTRAQIDGPVRAYYAACAEVLGPDRVGLYGEYDLIEAALDWGTVRWFWQTAALAWSPAGRPHPAAHIIQYRNGVTVAGGECDLDRAPHADFGQWEKPMTQGEFNALMDGYLVHLAGGEAGTSGSQRAARSALQSVMWGAPLPTVPAPAPYTTGARLLDAAVGSVVPGGAPTPEELTAALREAISGLHIEVVPDATPNA